MYNEDMNQSTVPLFSSSSFILIANVVLTLVISETLPYDTSTTTKLTRLAGKSCHAHNSTIEENVLFNKDR